MPPVFVCSASWSPQVLVTSAISGEGVPEVWETVLKHRQALEASGERQARRREQARAWMWSLVEEGLHQAFRSHPAVAERIPRAEREVEKLQVTPAAAARALLDAFRSG